MPKTNSQDKARANHQARYNKKTKTFEFYEGDIERLSKAKELGYKSQADMLKAALDLLQSNAKAEPTPTAANDLK